MLDEVQRHEVRGMNDLTERPCRADRDASKLAVAQAFLEKLASIERLSQVNGQITGLGRDRLIDVLIALQLDHRGHRDVLLRRLKNHFRKERTAAPKCTSSTADSITGCSFDYLCVVDFEATCDDRRLTPHDFKPEIVEFPAVLLDTRTRQIRFEFHRFCRPKLNPKLTDFCTKLTGITQDLVDRADLFDGVLNDFGLFLVQHGMGTEHSWVVVTDSHYDMCHFMKQQCVISGIPFPKFAKKWINIRKTFSHFYGCKALKLIDMLDRLGMEFEGRPHCGLDDARNVLRIALTLMADGAELRINESLDDVGRSVGNNGVGCRTNREPRRHRRR